MSIFVDCKGMNVVYVASQCASVLLNREKAIQIKAKECIVLIKHFSLAYMTYMVQLNKF